MSSSLAAAALLADAARGAGAGDGHAFGENWYDDSDSIHDDENFCPGFDNTLLLELHYQRLASAKLAADAARSKADAASLAKAKAEIAYVEAEIARLTAEAEADAEDPKYFDRDAMFFSHTFSHPLSSANMSSVAAAGAGAGAPAAPSAEDQKYFDRDALFSFEYSAETEAEAEARRKAEASKYFVL